MTGKKLVLFVMATLFSGAVAQATTTNIYQMPVRDGHSYFELLRDGKMGLDLGFRVPTYYYGFAINNLKLISDINSDSAGVYERKNKKQFYYFAQELDEANDHIKQTLKGYSTETYTPNEIFSVTLFEGGMYGADYLTAVMAADESKLYFMNVYENKLEAFDLETQARETILEIQELEDVMISKIENITFDGRAALAIITDAGYQQSAIVVVDVVSKAVVYSVTGYELGLRDADSEKGEPFNPNAVIDPQGNYGAFCDHDGCLLVTLKNKSTVKKFQLGGGNNSQSTISADGKYMYACNALTNQLIVMDTATGTEISSHATEICERGTNTMVGTSYVFQNHNQIFAISADGQFLDAVTADDSLNAFDDVEVLGEEQGQAAVISVDWKGQVQKHLLKLK